MATHATSLTTSFTSVSSLDTGRIGYFVAWGGSEDGYAYTYTLSGAPGGVTIDSDTGVLSIASPLAAGSYPFDVVATNREATSVSADFSYTLNVLTGVTSSRTGTQVLHKTYDPHSGTWGTPTGNNWTTVLLNIQTAIKADQVTNGEEQLRATIPFHKGATYQYTNNHWLQGIQYYEVTATGAGAAPILQNTNADNAYEGGPLNIGASGAADHQGSIKANSVLINTVAAGATSITCTTHAQTSRLIPGRWHAVVGSTIQIGGFPPNVMFQDYVKVATVNSGTGVVTLDRPLKYGYDSTWYEIVADDNNFGRGWIMPWDTGGSGGAIPADERITLRGRITGINFAKNANGDGAMLTSGHIDLVFDTCTMQGWQATMGKHYMAVGCTFQGGQLSGLFFEPDKLSETLILDNCTVSSVGGATGYQYFLARNTTFQSTITPLVQISPRYFRSLTCTYDCQSNAFPPFTYANNGPNWYDDFQSSIFTSSVSTPWTFTGGPNAPLAIGTDGNWSGNQLRIPNSFSGFQAWLENSYAGGIVAVSATGPITANWGYISSVTSDGAGGALWLNIVWVNGVKPTSGTIDNASCNGRRLNMTSPSFTGSVTYADAKFAKQTVTGHTSWDFPAGYPFDDVALGGGVRAQSQSSAILHVAGTPTVVFAGRTRSVSKGTMTLPAAPVANTWTLTAVSVTASVIIS